MLAAVTLAVLAAAVVAGAVLRGPVVETVDSDPSQSPTPTTTPLSRDEQPGPRTVTFTEGAADHPDRDGVRALLQGHFDAINLRDYRRWTTTVISDRVATTPEAAWREQYRSTTDGGILVHRLEPRFGGGLTVLLSFTSVQDPADAPEDMPYDCLRWRVTYSVVSESGRLRLGPADPGTSQRAPCS